jgi:hypothetical protein
MIIYTQNNDLCIQIKNIERDTINKPSQKRESLRPLSRPSRDESEIVYKRKLTEITLNRYEIFMNIKCIKEIAKTVKTL